MPEENVSESGQAQTETKVCGIIMPISPTDGYPVFQWKNVQNLLEEVIESAGLRPNLVSNSDEVNIIQNTIVTNLYEYDICVCDISSRNPNVAFELGMRLTFDKPTVIIKDEKTIYPFDFSILEYLEYPSDLRYHDILKFKDDLRNKILKTITAKQENPNYSPFIKHFSRLKVTSLEQKDISLNEFFQSSIQRIEKQLTSIANQSQRNSSTVAYPPSINTSSDITNYNKVLSLVRSLMLVKGITDPKNLNHYFEVIIDYAKNIHWIQDYEDEDEIRRILDLIHEHGA